MGGVGHVMNHVCRELKGVPTKIFCIMLVILQSFFMDVIIINCYGDGLSVPSTCQYCKKCYWWILGDVVVVACFIVTFVTSYKHLAFLDRFQRLSKNHISRGLPLSCLTWFLYSCCVATKVAVIFRSTVNDKLKEDDFYGPQFLKTGICLSGVVFILFVSSHHRAKENSKERMYINAMATGVTFDVLDTVDFLDVLFVNETHTPLPYTVENAIIGIAVVNLLRPTFSFLVLTVNHLGASKVSRELSAANALVYILLVNVPFMAIRMYLWHNLNHDISVFLVKNFVMIFLGIHELHEIGMEKTKELGDLSGIEMIPRLTTAHRPSDLVDGSEDNLAIPPTYNHSLMEEGTDHHA